jgi:hypothetical protein
MSGSFCGTALRSKAPIIEGMAASLTVLFISAHKKTLPKYQDGFNVPKECDVQIRTFS